MSITHDKLKEMVDELSEEYGVKTGEEKPKKDTPEKEVTAEDIRKKFFVAKSKSPDRKEGQVEFDELVGSPSPDGKKHYFTVLEDNTDPDIQADVPDLDKNVKPDLDILLHVLLAVEQSKPMLLFGKTGAGKTTYVKYAAALLNYPYIRLSGMEGIEPADLIGQVGITDGETAWEDGDLAHAVRHGYLVADDEPFKNSPGVNMAKQWLTETDDPYLKMVGNHEERKLKPHKNFRIIMCDNVRGTGDGTDVYAATTIQDQSTINRIIFKQYVDYLPADEEVALIRHKYPEIKEPFAKKMVKLGNTIRKVWDEGNIELAWSVRQLMEWSEASLYFQDPVRAFKLVYFSALNDEEKTVVSQLWIDVDFYGQRLN